MIQSVQIQNFKSVVDLTLELGTFNVLVGANGCGKSNILEAITFGAAASADKLDQEFLGSRGIRITNPEFMYSAFSKNEEVDSIQIKFEIGGDKISFTLLYLPYNKKWIEAVKAFVQDVVQEQLPNILAENDYQARQTLIKNFFRQNPKVFSYIENLKTKSLSNTEDLLPSFFEVFIGRPLSNEAISNYILYSPEQTSLRKFEDTNQIYPLGIKGEGLFQYLKELSQDEKNGEILNEIKECLLLLDWYEDFKLPQNLMSNEFALSIKDKYLNEDLQFFDQRSTNEGFLFLLFYATLFTSKDTPQFFAIDNIDTSFNPKLCMQVTKMLAELAKKHGKQVIVTTQNPAILDGLDLQDDSQRLFVIRRNEEGHTKAKRIEHKAERTMKLSEVWTNGFIGGLPDNF